MSIGTERDIINASTMSLINRVRIALAKNAGCLQNGSHMLLPLLQNKYERRLIQVNSSMHDPFSKHPALLAKGILTLLIAHLFMWATCSKTFNFATCKKTSPTYPASDLS